MPPAWNDPTVTLSGASDDSPAISVSGSLVFPTTDCGAGPPSGQAVTLTNATNVAYAYTLALQSGAFYFVTTPSSGTLAARSAATVVVTPQAVLPGPGVLPGASPYADDLLITVATSPASTFVVPISWTLNGAVLSLPAGRGASSDPSGAPFYLADSTGGLTLPLLNTGTATARVDAQVQPPGAIAFAPALPISVLPGIATAPALLSTSSDSTMPRRERRDLHHPRDRHVLVRGPRLPASPVSLYQRARLRRSLPMTDSPVDRALALLSRGEPAAALRWSLAALEREPAAEALFVTSRALGQLGSARAANDGLRLAASRAAGAGDAPLAIAAIADLRALGVDVRGLVDEIASSLSSGALGAGFGGDRGAVPARESSSSFATQAPLVALSPVVAHRALVSRAAQMIYESAGLEWTRSAPLAFLGALPREAVRDFILAFEITTADPGHHLVEEGELSDCSFVLVRGGAELSRRGRGPTAAPARLSARLEQGAFFGELALFGHLRAAATVVTTHPSVLLVGWRDAMEAVSARHPELHAALSALWQAPGRGESRRRARRSRRASAP